MDFIDQQFFFKEAGHLGHESKVEYFGLFNYIQTLFYYTNYYKNHYTNLIVTGFNDANFTDQDIFLYSTILIQWFMIGVMFAVISNDNYIEVKSDEKILKKMMKKHRKMMKNEFDKRMKNEFDKQIKEICRNNNSKLCNNVCFNGSFCKQYKTNNVKFDRNYCYIHQPFKTCSECDSDEEIVFEKI